MLDFVGTVEAGELPDGRLIVLAHGPLDERIVAFAKTYVALQGDNFFLEKLAHE